METNIIKLTNLVFILSLITTQIARSELRSEEIYEKAVASVLTLEVENAQKEKFVGSAFVALRPDLVITAWHVVHDAKKIEAWFPGRKQVRIIGLVAKDERRDLALLQIESTERPMIRLASQNPKVGARVYAIGSPQGLDFSFVDGLLSQIRQVDGLAQYQLSCPISPGNSGGPVLNNQGELVGVISWRKQNAQNISFAIPSEALSHLELSATNSFVFNGSKQNIPHAHSESVSARQEKPQAGLLEFQRTLTAQAGQTIAVTIESGGLTKRFEFVAPQATDLVKGKRESASATLP